MLRPLHLSVPLACMLVAGGCVIRHMDEVPLESRVLRPPPGASLVFLVRPDVGILTSSAAGGSEAAFVFDDEFYVGTLEQDQHIAYVTKPGRHLFVVTSEAADFMEAELLPDKTYYATLRRRFGHIRARFSLVPAVDPDEIREAKAVVASATQVRVNERGLAWDRGKHETHMRLKMRYFPMWEAKSDRPLLPAGAGQ